MTVTSWPRRAIDYGANGVVVFGVVGVAKGRALGVLLTYCPTG